MVSSFQHGEIILNGYSVDGFSECMCCSGDGDYKDVQVKCGDNGPITAKVKSMTTCGCNQICRE